MLAQLHDRAHKAAVALVARPKAAQGRQLFEPDGDFWELVLTLQDDCPLPLHPKPYYAPLKHRIWPPDVEVALFCRPPRADYKAVCAAAAPEIKKVIDIPRLKEWYNTFKLRAHLLKSFPVFLADREIYYDLMPHLGRKFWVRRCPHPIHLSKDPKNLGREVRKVLNRSLILFKDVQRSYNVLVGKTTLGAPEVADNVLRVMRGVVRRLPHGWSDVSGLALKTTSSPALLIHEGPLRPLGYRGPPTTLTAGQKGALLAGKAQKPGLKKTKSGSKKAKRSREEEEEEKKKDTEEPPKASDSTPDPSEPSAPSSKRRRKRLGDDS